MCIIKYSNYFFIHLRRFSPNLFEKGCNINFNYFKMKKIVFLVLLVVLHISTFAQNNQEKKLPGYKTSFETNKFWDNWFISLNSGLKPSMLRGLLMQSSVID